jgi:hypothetical protein
MTPTPSIVLTKVGVGVIPTLTAVLRKEALG